MTGFSKRISTVAVVATLGLLLVTAGMASAFPITGTLVGDPRPGNPDNLIVDVTITTVGDLATFTVDLNSPLHPSIKLGGFFFNVAILATDVSLNGVTAPLGWELTSGNNAQGSGSANFDFEVSDASGPPNNTVTNATNLVFTIKKASGAWVDNDFLTAEDACSNDAALGCGQLGAHLQSLSTANCTGCTDSGFALGDYKATTKFESVPEPSTLLLLTSGVVGALTLRRLRRRQL